MGVTVCLSVCHSVYFRKAYRIQTFSSHLELDRGPGARARACREGEGGVSMALLKQLGLPSPGALRFPRLGRGAPQWPGPPHEALLNSAMNKSGRGERDEERKEEEEEEEGERATGVER